MTISVVLGLAVSHRSYHLNTSTFLFPYRLCTYVMSEGDDTEITEDVRERLEFGRIMDSHSERDSNESRKDDTEGTTDSDGGDSSSPIFTTDRSEGEDNE